MLENLDVGDRLSVRLEMRPDVEPLQQIAGRARDRDHPAIEGRGHGLWPGHRVDQGDLGASVGRGDGEGKTRRATTHHRQINFSR